MRGRRYFPVDQPNVIRAVVAMRAGGKAKAIKGGRHEECAHIA